MIGATGYTRYPAVRRIPRIGIVIGSTREGRFSEKPAQWIATLAAARKDCSFEVVDLRDHPMPFFNEASAPVWGMTKDASAVRWGSVLERLDGLIVITPEYNHGPSAVLKNALDYAYWQLNRKPIGFVGYGGVGGARAIEHLRLVSIELQMIPVRPAVHIAMAEFMGISQQGKDFESYPHLDQAANAVLDHVTWWAHLLTPERRASEQHLPG